MNSYQFRLYTLADKAACLAIFDSNTPPYFDPTERAPFAHWLDAQAKGELAHGNSTYEYYEVALLGTQMVGCAGYYIAKEAPIARMAWGMVHKDFHQQGIGSAHLKHRIQLMQSLYPGYKIDLGTSQHTYAFYERHGFVVTHFVPNGYGEGIDRYDMDLQL